MLFLRFGGFLSLLQRLFLEGWQTGLGSAVVLMNMITLFLRFGGRRSRSREDVDLPDGTQQIADVVGEPVHQHSEWHGNAGENVHDREHPQHHLLHHFGLLVCRRLSHVTLHAVVLHEPQAEAHQCNEDGDNYFAMHGSGREVISHVHAEHCGGRELLGCGDVESAKTLSVPEFAACDVRNG